MRKHKNKIIACLFVLVVLATVYWWGGNAPSLRGWNPEKSETVQTSSSTNTKTENEEISPEPEKATDNSLEINEENNTSESSTDSINTKENTEQPVTQEPVSSVEAKETSKDLFCTLSVRCDTILNNMDWLDKNKASFVPSNGIVFPQTKVIFYDGESVFNVLAREMKKNNIHLEFMSTPIYNSAYIEGISNLYEYDCGELSGWMYKVNGVYPTYGSSRHILKPGDEIEWLYTCDLGADIGNRNLAKQKDE